MAEKDWIALVKEFVIEQSSGIKNSIFYAEDVGGVKYEFVLEFPDNIPTKTGISGSEIIDVNKTLDDTIVNVQRVFPDGEVIVDYSFNAKGKGGDVQALDNFNKILKEGKGMKGVLLEYYDTFPVETTIPTTLENDITIPNTLESIDTPTNVVDEGIELYHSISKGQTVNKNLHAGTYNAALDRASQFYGGEQLYKIANDNLNFIQEQANDLVSELSEQVSFEKVEDFYEVTDGMVTREITITLPTGVEADFNIVAETSNNDLTVKFQDLDGYDGAEIYSETLWDIENEPNSLKSSTSTINIIDDENVAEGLLDEIGLKSQAGDFNLRNGYDLYKVNINPSANVVNIPNTAIFVENGIKKEMSSDFIQGFIERPETINQYKNVEQIIIDGKSYDITDSFTSAQALQEHFKDADVLVYINDIEDVGSKSYIFMNENSYVLEKINDAQFNTDVANKYIKNNPYETISKLAREEAFTEPERYQVLLDALLNETDTPTNVVGDEFVDNIVNANTQLVNDLPLSETVKNQFDNVVRNRAKNLATPGGVIDAVDVWEMGVLGLMITAIAYKEFDEIPTIFKRTATNMFNSMTSMYNIPPVPLEQYDLDYEFIEKVITTGEKVMPTDIIIKKVGEIAKGVGEKGLATGFGYVPTTPKNTDTMETTQKIQPGVQEEKMFEQLRPKKIKSAGGSGARIQ